MIRAPDFGREKDILSVHSGIFDSLPNWLPPTNQSMRPSVPSISTKPSQEEEKNKIKTFFLVAVDERSVDMGIAILESVGDGSGDFPRRRLPRAQSDGRDRRSGVEFVVGLDGHGLGGCGGWSCRAEVRSADRFSERSASTSHLA